MDSRIAALRARAGRVARRRAAGTVRSTGTRRWPPTAATRTPDARRPGPRRARTGRRRGRGRSPGALPPLAMGVVALVSGLMTTSVVHDAGTRRDAWGTTATVARAAHDLGAGAVVTPADVVWDAVPAELVPAAAVGLQPAGRATREPVVAGELFLPQRLAPEGVRGLAARLPAGHAALALPIESRTPPLEPGQRVALFGSGASTDRSPIATSDGRDRDPPEAEAPLTSEAVVIDVAERQVTVAMPQREVPRVAALLVTGTVIVAIEAP